MATGTDISIKPAKFYLIRFGQAYFAAVINIHTAFVDATSTGVIFRKLARTYHALEQGGQSTDEIDSSFEDYVHFHPNRFDTGQVRAYWQEEFERVEPLNSNAFQKDVGYTDSKIIMDGPEAREVLLFCKEAECGKNKIGGVD